MARRQNTHILSWRSGQIGHRMILITASQQITLPQGPSPPAFDRLGPVVVAGLVDEQFRVPLAAEEIVFEHAIKQESVGIIRAAVVKGDKVVCCEVATVL